MRRVTWIGRGSLMTTGWFRLIQPHFILMSRFLPTLLAYARRCSSALLPPLLLFNTALKILPSPSPLQVQLQRHQPLRFQARRLCRAPPHADPKRCCSQALSKRVFVEGLQRRLRALRHHCASLRCGQDACGCQRCRMHSKGYAGTVHQRDCGQAVGRAVPMLVHRRPR